MKHIEVSTGSVLSGLVFMFISPAIAMVAWGAFVEMSGVSLPKFSYWEFFMLNLACTIFRTSVPLKWDIKE